MVVADKKDTLKALLILLSVCVCHLVGFENKLSRQKSSLKFNCRVLHTNKQIRSCTFIEEKKRPKIWRLHRITQIYLNTAIYVLA